MGNPLSPIIANLVMEDLLDRCTEAVGFEIPILKKYVDDLFLAIPQDKVDEVKDIFNEQEASLQFTVESEQEHRLPFLDMVVIRKSDQTLKTEWYMKPIASGRFLNYHSRHPLHLKINVAFNFAKRVCLFSSNSSQNQIHNTIRQHLLINDYPKSLISRVINRIRENQTRDTSRDTAMEVSGRQQTEREKIFRSLTNIDSLSDQIRKTLRKDYPNVCIASKTTKTISSLLPPVKDKTPPEQQSNVVYQIPCAECEACYIGMTTNKLTTRISGHRHNMKQLQTLRLAGYTQEDREMINLKEKTALVAHAAIANHNFKLEESKIIDRTFDSSKLPILESCHIKNTHNTINKRTDTDNLHASYAEVLQLIGTIRTAKQPDQNRENVNIRNRQDNMNTPPD